MAYPSGYEKVNWQNENTPLNATNLNRMENGIDDVQIDEDVITLFESLGWSNDE